MKDTSGSPITINIPVSHDLETNVCFWLENKTSSSLKTVCLMVSFHRWWNNRITWNKEEDKRQVCCSRKGLKYRDALGLGGLEDIMRKTIIEVRRRRWWSFIWAQLLLGRNIYGTFLQMAQLWGKAMPASVSLPQWWYLLVLWFL